LKIFTSFWKASNIKARKFMNELVNYFLSWHSMNEWRWKDQTHLSPLTCPNAFRLLFSMTKTNFSIRFRSVDPLQFQHILQAEQFVCRKSENKSGSASLRFFLIRRKNKTAEDRVIWDKSSHIKKEKQPLGIAYRNWHLFLFAAIKKIQENVKV
jgi:hypothetical protein